MAKPTVNQDLSGLFQGGPDFSLLGSLKPQHLTALGFVSDILKVRQLLGGAVFHSMDAMTITPAAANNSRIEGKNDLIDRFEQLDATQDNQEIVIDKAWIQIQAYSTVNFTLIPFLVRMENGETIATTDDADNPDPVAMIDAAVNGMFAVKLGLPIIPKLFIDNGTKRFAGKQTVDMTQELKRVIKDYYRLVSEEALTPELWFGVYAICEADNTSVSFETNQKWVYHFKESSRLRL